LSFVTGSGTLVLLVATVVRSIGSSVVVRFGVGGLLRFLLLLFFLFLFLFLLLLFLFLLLFFLDFLLLGAFLLIVIVAILLGLCLVNEATP